MDSVDPIQRLALSAESHHLRVTQTDKDGRQKPSQEQHDSPHDVLELHDQEVEIVEEAPQDSGEEPPFGLDLAV